MKYLKGYKDAMAEIQAEIKSNLSEERIKWGMAELITNEAYEHAVRGYVSYDDEHSLAHHYYVSAKEAAVSSCEHRLKFRMPNCKEEIRHRWAEMLVDGIENDLVIRGYKIESGHVGNVQYHSIVEIRGTNEKIDPTKDMEFTSYIDACKAFITRGYLTVGQATILSVAVEGK